MRVGGWSNHALLFSSVLAVSVAGVGCDILNKLAKKKDSASKDTPSEKVEEEIKPKEGEACSSDKAAACKDASTMLECNDGKWGARPCRGKDGCKGTLLIQCDQTLAKVGDACGKEENFSCTEDGKKQVKCIAGKWAEVALCRGPKACETKFPFSNCDQSVAQEGDACTKDGNAACTEDKKGVIECKGGKYGSKQPCPKGCVHEGIFVKCN